MRKFSSLYYIVLVRIELWVLCPFQNVERATCKEIEATGVKV